MNHRELIALEGLPFILFFLVSGLIFHFLLGPIAALPFLLLTLFCLFFFRNPERHARVDSKTMISPADGLVMDIEKIYEDRYFNCEMIRIRIFLSLFNVHINRMPIAGRIDFVERAKGIYLPAFNKEAGSKNVRNYILINTKWGRVMVVQITGIVARRLVCWIKAGDTLPAGERFGLIRFGSCTEVYVPVHTNIFVKPGDKVKGGETAIAELSE